MFLGRFHHSIDDKGRLTIPSRFRELVLAEGAYIMQGFDQNLMVLPSTTYDKWSSQVDETRVTDPAARVLRRLLYSTASPVEIDKAGRMLIPQFLRQSANLESEVVIAGNRKYFEIWSPEQWAVQEEQLQDAESKAELFAAFDVTSG